MLPSFRLTQARRQLDTLIASELSVSDGSAGRNLAAAKVTLRSLAGIGDADALATLARDYSLAAERAHNQVVLLAAGAVRASAARRPFDAEGILARYTNACIGVEQAILALQNTAAQILQSPKQYAARPIMLLMEASTLHARDAVARIAENYGEVKHFAYVPYVGVRCAVPLADELLRARASLSLEGLASARPARTYAVQPIRAQKIDKEYDWNLQMIGAEDAWDTVQGEGATVAIIDTGIDKNHHDLAGNFSDGWGIDLVDNGEPMDQNGHGTHVAGTVAGALTGVAPNATLYAVRVLDADGFGDEVTVLQGIEWAINKKAAVINMSLGSAEPSDAERKLVNIAAAQGIAVACAAGNDGDTSYNYPASYDGAISVAAVDSDKYHARFSNRNDLVDLCAPGVSIYSLAPNGGYTYLSGTSMATPHVAGACALLRSAHIQNGERALKASAEKLGESAEFGAGLIRLVEAIRYGNK